MRHTKINPLFILMTTLYLTSCLNNESTEKKDVDFTYMPKETILSSYIRPPLPGFEEKNESFIIDAQSDNELITKGGSKIKIYANSIIDKQGNQINGDVEIQFRDYHNPLEIFLSGIPMEYDSAGVKYIFETAGMFEIKAIQKDKELEIKPNSKIDIDFISTSNESGFNFYQFNENEGQWINQNSEYKTIVKPNKEMENKITINKPIAQNKKNYSFNIKVEENNYSELKDYEGTIFETLDNNNFNPIYYNVQWDKAEIIKTPNKTYVLELFKEDTSITIAVRPVIKTEKYKQAMAKYHKETEKLKKSKTEKNDFDIYSTPTIAYNSDYSVQNTVIQQLQINGFGVYNLDKPGIFTPTELIKDLIVEEDGVVKELKLNQYYVVDLKRNAIITLNEPKYYKNDETVIWSVIDNKKMIIITPPQIKTITNRKLITKVYSAEEGLGLLDGLIANK